MPAPKSPFPRMPIDSDHRHHLENGRALVEHRRAAENKKEHERKEVVEEEDGAVPSRQLQIDLEKAKKAFIR